MKIISDCPVCDAKIPVKQHGFIPAFIVKRVFGWEPVHIVLPNTQTIPLDVRCGIIICPDCGFICNDVRYDDEEMARIYHDYRQTSYNEERIKYETWYINVSKEIETKDIDIRRPIMAEFLQRCDILAPHRFLDYGSGNGNYIPKEIFPTTEFISYDPYYNEVEPSGSFDFVSCCHVLEHVIDPKKLINHMKTFTTSGTIFYLEVPLEEAEDTNILNGRQFHEHINVFRKKSFKRLIKETGLELITLEDFPIDLSTGPNIFMRALARVL